LCSLSECRARDGGGSSYAARIFSVIVLSGAERRSGLLRRAEKIFHIFQSGLQGGSAVVVEGRKKLLKPLVVEETPMSAHTSMKKFLITAAAVAMSTVGLAACSNDSAATPTKSSETSTEKSTEKSSEGSSDKMSSEKATSESTSGDKMGGDSDKMGGEGDKMEHDDKMSQ
jgi:hypothetical protein